MGYLSSPRILDDTRNQPPCGCRRGNLQQLLLAVHLEAHLGTSHPVRVFKRLVNHHHHHIQAVFLKLLENHHHHHHHIQALAPPPHSVPVPRHCDKETALTRTFVQPHSSHFSSISQSSCGRAFSLWHSGGRNDATVCMDAHLGCNLDSIDSGVGDLCAHLALCHLEVPACSKASTPLPPNFSFGPCHVLLAGRTHACSHSFCVLCLVRVVLCVS